MVTIKSFTDLEQSKKLAEFLPLESADMSYKKEFITTSLFGEPIYDYEVKPDYCKRSNLRESIPCWSLAALLNILPMIIGDVLSKNALRLRMDKGETNFNIWYENLDSGMVEEGLLDIIKSNPIDACYEIIIKLHELNLL